MTLTSYFLHEETESLRKGFALILTAWFKARKLKTFNRTKFSAMAVS